MQPYPPELVPFAPIDGPDNRYSQLYKPIGKDPFIDAGLKGWAPTQPISIPAHMLAAGDKDDFHWPSLQELNDEIAPFPWETGEEEAAEHLEDDLETVPVMYHGPNPAPPEPFLPTVPTIATLASQITSSKDRLFFIAHSLLGTDNAEWRLVRVMYQDSVALRPSCLQDGRFLVEFYVCHTTDIRYNGLNKRFWLQYHKKDEFLRPLSTSETHLVRPSDSSARYALRHNLVPFRLWVNLTHTSTYIHGPFDFTAVNGRLTRDRIGVADWQILHNHRSMYRNAPPKMELPVFSIHVDRGAHSVSCTLSDVASLQATSLLLQSPSYQLFPDKRSSTERTPP